MIKTTKYIFIYLIIQAAFLLRVEAYLTLYSPTSGDMYIVTDYLYTIAVSH